MGLHVPRVVWIGVPLLGFTAGMVNAAGYLGFEHQAISHLTGTTSLAALALGEARWTLALQLASVMAGFVAGGYVIGLILRARELSWTYVGLLGAQSVLLLCSATLLKQNDGFGASLAAAACGLQNAMTTFYRGSAIRSTHLTGFFTDLGLSLGQATRGAPLPWRRVVLGALMLAAFIAGGLVTALAFPRWGFSILNGSAALIGLMGLALGLYLLRIQHRRGRQEEDPATASTQPATRIRGARNCASKA